MADGAEKIPQDIWKALCDKYGYPKVTQEVKQKDEKKA